MKRKSSNTEVRSKVRYKQTSNKHSNHGQQRRTKNISDDKSITQFCTNVSKNRKIKDNRFLFNKPNLLVIEVWKLKEKI